MAYRHLVSITDTNNVVHDLPDPSEYDAVSSTMVDSARNADGKMVGSVIRHDVAKVTMKWRFLTVEQWADILQLFTYKEGVYSGSFINSVTFFCQTSGDWETRDMYVSDRKASIYLRKNNSDKDVMGYRDVSLSLIEV